MLTLSNSVIHQRTVYKEYTNTHAHDSVDCGVSVYGERERHGKVE